MSLKVEGLNKLKVFLTAVVIILLFVFAQFFKSVFDIIENEFID